MSEPKYFKACINPLVFFPLDEVWSSIHKEPLTVQLLLKNLCAPDIDSSIDAISQRYKVISQQPAQFIAPPSEDNILRKLVWPLRNAKTSYILGDYLGTIAICGMVCEMLTLLIFEISDTTAIRKESVAELKNIQLLDSTNFEKLGQKQRVKILRSNNLIDDTLKSALDTVRDKRRLYLHFLSKKYQNIQTDAVQVFNATVKALINVVGQEIKENGVMINPMLLKYLESKGVAGSTSSDASAPANK
jgi:hypothetical protein